MITAPYPKLLAAATLLAAACGSKPPLLPEGGAPLIVTAEPGAAVVGVPYGFQLEATAGVGTRTWAISSVPAELSWLAIDPATGNLSGTPGGVVMPGANFSASVADGQGRSDSKVLKLTVLACAPEGSRTECYRSDGTQCLRNTVLCSNGRVPTCGAGGIPSPALDRCGSTCGACSLAAADGCQGTCQCGSGPACSGVQATCCAAACTDLQTDLQNCGACGAACPATGPAHSHPTCTAGSCGFACDTGFSACNGTCVDLQRDKDNCASCGHVCATPVCSAGACVPICNTGFTPCNGACVQTGTDVSNCGTCGNACPAGPAGSTTTCAAGSCRTTCIAGLASCAGGTVCADLAADPSNCSACGTVCAAGPANSSPRCITSACGWNCNAGFTNCGDACVDLASSVSNCGACGAVCSDPAIPAGASDVCQNSTCGWACPPSTRYCDVLQECLAIGAACRLPTCFVAGTPVALADGGEKAIEDVAVGDRVLSYDTSAGAFVEGLVTELLVHPDSPALLRINGSLTTTPEHPFFASDRWVRADALRVGDELLRAALGPDGAGGWSGTETVVQLELFPGGVTTYNLEVAGVHDYFAGGVLVHNIKVIP